MDVGKTLTEDVVSIQQLVCAERQARDRGWWDEMRAAWAEDSHVRVSWYSGSGQGFVDGSIQSKENGTSAKHKLGPIVVRVNGNKAVALLNATICTQFTVNGVEADLDCDTRLIYRAFKMNATWLLTHLDCVYESDRMSATTPGEQLVIDRETLDRYRKSYRCLSFILEQTGKSVNKDLPGDDRPDQVRQLYKEVFAWAELPET